MTNIEYINSKLFLYVIFIKGDSSSALACHSTCISTKKRYLLIQEYVVYDNFILFYSSRFCHV